MEKTLSDSSLNSEHHKDFPKSMSYFSRGSENDARFSSDDEYDEYATEPNYGGKHDIYVWKDWTVYYSFAWSLIFLYLRD